MATLHLLLSASPFSPALGFLSFCLVNLYGWFGASCLSPRKGDCGKD